MTKINPRWSPNMMRRRGSTHAAQQVRCLTGYQGSEWIHGVVELHLAVRQRLAESAHSICPSCAHMDACEEAAARGLRRPTISVYFAVIDAIERRLTDGPAKPLLK